MTADFPVGLTDIALRRDLIADGWTDRAIARQVRSGVLTKVRYDAYVRSALVTELDATQHLRVRSRAVLRTAHATSVLANYSALAEYDVPLWGVDPDETHVIRTCPRGDPHPRARVGLVAASGVLSRKLATPDQLRAQVDLAEHWPHSLAARIVARGGHLPADRLGLHPHRLGPSREPAPDRPPDPPAPRELGQARCLSGHWVGESRTL